MPIHWGKFDLTNHKWADPIERFLAAAQSYAELDITTPKIGQVFQVNEALPKAKWWEGVK